MNKINNMIGILLPFTLSAFSVFSISMVLLQITNYFKVPLYIISFTFPLDFIGGAVGGVILGKFADKIGRKMTTIISILIFSISLILASFSNSLIELFICWFFIGFGVNAENGIAYALIVETLGSYTGSFGGLVQGLYYIGFGLDVLTYRFIAYWRTLFLIVGIISLAIGLPSSIIIKETLKRTQTKPVGIRNLFNIEYRYKTILLSLIVIGAFLLSVPLLSIVPSFMEKINMTNYIGVLSIVGFLSYWFSGFLSDKIGRAKNTLIFSSLGLLSAILLIFFGISSLLIVVFLALLYISSGLFSYDGIWVSENYPIELRATASNFVFMFGRLIGGFAPEITSLIGSLNLSYGLGIVSAISSALILISSIIFTRFK
ncbi:sugar phosphate permease [Caldisphaera lagunensis DSM 15908]|uniref:Sugar phosphate permease n=1 Tax=Caldisphaera lagunensis (strain DSM 15908 / JCM 11604 / ANMR 0165 / IC-154) TaxID=1056495 RepID=L0AB54_CALLD|nr:MFS transporter [Caldisphaera lagunensis]AFZ71123.1 sugar phosphate permease [Caldisphaera lagunensis DSM 15908]